MCIAEDGAVSRVSGDPQEPLAGQLHAVLIVTNDGVVQHLAREAELAVRGSGRKGE